MKNALSDTIFSRLESLSQQQSDVVAIEGDARHVSYRELRRLVSRWKSLINGLNLPQGACIGLRFVDQTEYLICHLALLELNITQVVIDVQDPLNIQAQHIEQLVVDVVIQDLADAPSSFNCLVANALTLGDMSVTAVKQKPYSAETALLFLGSGTTSVPKMIALSALEYAALLRRELNALNVSLKERYFCYSRVSYTFPRRKAILCLLQGATLLLPSKAPMNLIEFINDKCIQHLVLTVDQAQRFLLLPLQSEGRPCQGYQLPRVKSLQLSSSLIKQSVRERILECITPNLFISYGTNEVGIVSLARPDDIKSTPGTVGRILGGIEVRLLKTSEKSLVGDVLIKTDHMFTGYVANPAANQKSFSHSGWYQPNDLARLTDDGQLIIEGRSDDMMIFTGVNLYPRPMEEVLEQHDAVAEAAVFPITVGWQENIPVAMVTLTKQVDEKTLIEHCDQHLGWRRPQKIFITESLPRNAAGKVLKRTLIDNLESALKKG
ncbi:class I adenylate-forming enzyme family protein [Marinomonas fungiae]|uniref:class I adenylate-forming enzyme family protein n=1 Tax=Marinomonas fungiae TaxID=1137284 RepID=UPI003A8ED939